jgi:hypothetical protein
VFGALLLLVLLAPTTQSLMGWEPKVRWQWRLSPAWGAFAGLVLALATIGIGQTSAFIYFQF